MNPEYARIRDYLTAQGAKLPPAAIADKVRAAMAQLRTAAAAVPAARFTERPAPEEWSVGAPPPALPRERAPAAETRTAEAWHATLERDREALFARVAGAEPSARLDVTIEHFMFGPLNWRETLLFMRLHDLDHAGQLDKIAVAYARR